MVWPPDSPRPGPATSITCRGTKKHGSNGASWNHFTENRPLDQIAEDTVARTNIHLGAPFESVWVVASVKYPHKVDRHVSPHMICHCSRGRNQRRQRTLEMPCLLCQSAVMFLNDTATTEIYTLSLHDALPI